MNEDLSRAFDDLIFKINQLGADFFVEEIRSVVSRGTIEIEGVHQKSEVVQQPLSPKAAYLLAAEMLIAAIDPILIHDELNREFSAVSSNTPLLSWEHDTIKDNLFEPAKGEIVSFPEIMEKDIQALRDAAKQLLQILDEFNSKE